MNARLIAGQAAVTVVLAWQSRCKRYNPMLKLAESVACIEMPKGITRLVPDVALGAEIWAFFNRARGLVVHQMVVGLGRPTAKRTMVNFPGRDRRRRVLKDEVLAASTNHAVLQDDDTFSDVPRYSEAAGVEHHPQITDFVPRRHRTIAALVLSGAIVTGTLSALQLFVLPLSEARGVRNVGALGVSGAAGLASWSSAVLLLVASATCLITYSIRQHRIDDFRGRYRVWRGAAVACLMMSVISVTGLHHIIAASLTHLTGWSALRDGAVWWLVLPGLPMAWVGIRTLLDVRECRLAATLISAAVISYAIAAASYLGMAPVVFGPNRSLVEGAAILMGHWLLLASVTSYARYVILDAQGLIPVHKKPSAKRSEEEDDEELEQLTRPTATTTTKTRPAVATSGQTPQMVNATDDDNRWVDGSRPERRRYDDGDDDEESSHDNRKLSKADRKRLRRLKADGRAA